jgi:hypothetical protein
MNADSSIILSQRLKWYRGQMAVAISRHRHVLVLSLLLLIPSAMEWETIKELTRIISIPVLHMAYPGSAMGQAAIYYLLLILVFIGWVKLQKSAVKGEPFISFVRTLPLPPTLAWRTDIYLVLLADGILWLLFIAAFIFVPYADLSLTVLLGFFLRTAALAATLVCAQAAYVYLERGAFLFPLFAYAVIFVVGALTGWWDNLVYALFTLALVSALLLRMKEIGGLLWAKWPRTARQVDSIHAGMRIHPVVAIYLRLLFAEHGTAVLARLALVLVVSAMLGLVVRSKPDASFEHVKDLFVAYTAWSAYVASGLFYYLHQERQAILPLLRTLPAPGRYWVLVDYAHVYAGLLLAVAPLAAYLVQSGHLTYASLIFSSSYVLLLLGVLYPIQTMMKKQASVTAFVACILWALPGLMN